MSGADDADSEEGDAADQSSGVPGTDSALPSFVLGFHGCDRDLAEAVFAGEEVLSPSENPYDWLGSGVYFGEHNARRAFDFASRVSRKPDPSGQSVRDPAVVGAVIDLGRCLNLLDARDIGLVRDAYDLFAAAVAVAGGEMPKNTHGPDKLNRKLDCAVIQALHGQREAKGLPPFHTVRAVFTEGGDLYPGAGFKQKSHIELAVRNPARILGYFRPLDADGRPRSFA